MSSVFFHRSSLTRFAWLAMASVLCVPAFGQLAPVCSWPLETTGSGITNVAYPDTNATYWTMPIDSTRWKSVEIKGTYPQARFFSFVSYVATGAVVADNSALNDVDLNPDTGSSNPFRQGSVSNGQDYYTVTVSQNPPAGSESNFLQLAPTRLAWIIYRIYVPNRGLDRNAGVPLPSITVVGYDGRSQTVPPCRSRNNAAGIANLVQNLTAQNLVSDLAFLQQLIAPGAGGISEPASCQPTPLVSWIPKNTGGYFPNPANKYIAIPGLCFERNRVVVIRGKGPVVPDTYNGGPIWEPNNIKMRYWSACNNNQRVPYPVVACQADHLTNLDSKGFYTYVISEPDSPGADTPPSWIPADATWLPWGSRRSANILLIRNMLPSPSFKRSVQAAIDQQCYVDNQQGVPPARADVVAAGSCAHGVMKNYYPRAVYCDKSLFISGGWKGCFAAAKQAGELTDKEADQ